MIRYTFAWALKVGSSGYVFAAKTLIAKKKWMQDLNNAILVAKEEAGIAPAPLARGAAAGADAVQPPPPASKPPKKSTGGSRAAKKPAASGGGKQAYEEWVIPSKVFYHLFSRRSL